MRELLFHIVIYEGLILKVLESRGNKIDLGSFLGGSEKTHGKCWGIKMKPKSSKIFTECFHEWVIKIISH